MRLGVIQHQVVPVIIRLRQIGVRPVVVLTGHLVVAHLGRLVVLRGHLVVLRDHHHLVVEEETNKVNGLKF